MQNLPSLLPPLLFTLLSSLLLTGATADPVVNLVDGATLVGISTRASTDVVTTATPVDIFKGIQYGTVAKRFEQAQLLATPAAAGITVQTKEFGAVCVQADGGWHQSNGGKPAMSENCLHLNVYRRSSVPAQPLPVMVFIHGGGFTGGAGSDYDGTNLAASQNVIVVTINYRLGPLGFLMTASDGSGGMNGILDQVVALQWVQRNIAAFGGDPNKVTVFAESAGSFSLCVIAVIPAARGLLHRAIMESGPCTSRLWSPAPAEYGWTWANDYVTKMGASNLQSLGDAATFPSDRFKGWANGCIAPFCVGSRVMGYLYGMDRNVMGSSDTLAARYSEPVGRDSWNIDALLIGVNSRDGIGPFLKGAYPMWGVEPADEQKYRSLLKYRSRAQLGSSASDSQVDQHVDSVLQTYSGQRTKYQGFAKPRVVGFIDYLGDQAITCPTKNLAAFTAAASLPTYAYVFGHLYGRDVAVQYGIVSTSNEMAADWTSHTGELDFVFGNRTGPSSLRIPFSWGEAELARKVQAYWGAFAHGYGGTDAEGRIQQLSPPGDLEPWNPLQVGTSESDQPAAPRSFMKFGLLHTLMIDSWHDEGCSALGESWTSEGGSYPHAQPNTPSTPSPSQSAQQLPIAVYVVLSFLGGAVAACITLGVFWWYRYRNSVSDAAGHDFNQL